MHSKGMGPLGVFFMFGVFYIVWFAGLGGFVGTIGYEVVTGYGMTGVMAFFFDNLNLWIFILSLVGLVGYGLFGVSQQ